MSRAYLIYDGGDEVRVPPPMGVPRADQMQGTPSERVCEVGGRVCYDSMGKGRPSPEYHRHIIESRHTSVHEHATFTVRIPAESSVEQIMLTCINRRGVWVETDWRSYVDVTANLRAVNEWNRYISPTNSVPCVDRMGDTLRHAAGVLAPQVVLTGNSPDFARFVYDILPPDGLTDDQAHVTLYLSSSRAVGEELIRHRYSPSRRSTRFCDESGAEWVVHPLLGQYYEDKSEDALERTQVRLHTADAIITGRDAYKDIADKLEAYLVRRGITKTDARKQARGAARGYLGLALETETVYTAPVSGWLDICRQRLHPDADAEIRAVAADALDCLKASRYGARFAHLTTETGGDGLAPVLADRP